MDAGEALWLGIDHGPGGLGMGVGRRGAEQAEWATGAKELRHNATFTTTNTRGTTK
jgi:hypothetical protein